MTTGATAGAAGASSAAGVAIQAIRASGAIVSVEAEDFLAILHKCETPLVVMAKSKMLHVHYQYLTSYKGLAFHTKTSKPLDLPANAERIIAQKMWMPKI